VTCQWAQNLIIGSLLPETDALKAPINFVFAKVGVVKLDNLIFHYAEF